MADTTIESFVDEIARRSKIDPAAAETAVGTILAVIKQEGNSSKVAQLFNSLPGAADLAQKHPVVVGSGGGVGGAADGPQMQIASAGWLGQPALAKEFCDAESRKGDVWVRAIRSLRRHLLGCQRYGSRQRS
jgi:hypothetical protein